MLDPPRPPTPSSPSPASYRPIWLQWWITMLIASTFILFAIVSEVFYYHSQAYHGFSIDASRSHMVQFFKSFLPSLLFVPLNWAYGNASGTIRNMQPYLLMSKGRASAKDSVLVSYRTKGLLGTLTEAMDRGHMLVFITTLFSLWGQIYSSIGGAYFAIVPINFNGSVSVSLNHPAHPNTLFEKGGNDVAGYVQYAAAYSSGYPTFMYQDLQDRSSAWAMTPFTLSSAQLAAFGKSINGPQILRVPHANAVRVHAVCSPATNITKDSTNGAMVIIARIGDSCSAQFSEFPMAVDGVLVDVRPAELGCLTAINASAPKPLNESQYPVTVCATGMGDQGTVSSVAFCYATYEMYDVTLEQDFLFGQISTQVQDASLVRGYYFGQDYLLSPNGFNNSFYEESPSLALANAVFNLASNGTYGSLNESGAVNICRNSTFLAETMLDTYLLYQTLLALPPGNVSSVNATYTYATNRIVAFGPSAHAIAALTGTTGLALIIVFLVHSYQRNQIERSGARVVEPPASIAALGTMVSDGDAPASEKPKFLDGLNPADTEELLEVKLTGWEFSLDADGRIIGRRSQT